MRKNLLSLFVLLLTSLFSIKSFAGSFAYVSLAEGYVSIIDLASNRLLETVDLSYYSSGDIGNIAATSKGRVYVLNGDGSVSVIERNNGEVDNIQGVNVANIGDIAANLAGNRIYVADFNARRVSVIDTESDTIIDRIDVDGNPRAIAVSPNGSRIYTANDDYTVSVVDTKTDTLVKVISVNIAPTALAVSPNGKYVYLLNEKEGLLYTIDAKKYRVVKKVKITSRLSKALSGYPTNMTISKNGRLLYASSSSSDMLFIINTQTMKLKRIADPYKYSYENIALSGNKLYLINSDDTLIVLNATTGKTISRVRIGNNPKDIAISPQ